MSKVADYVVILGGGKGGDAAGDELLAAERETSRAAVPCCYVNVYFVDKHAESGNWFIC